MSIADEHALIELRAFIVDLQRVIEHADACTFDKRLIAFAAGELKVCPDRSECDCYVARIEAAARGYSGCNGSCDIALARRQVGPDAVVPHNARECAELWEREASRLGTALSGANHLYGLALHDTKVKTGHIERLQATVTELARKSELDTTYIATLRAILVDAGKEIDAVYECLPLGDDARNRSPSPTRRYIAELERELELQAFAKLPLIRRQRILLEQAHNLLSLQADAAADKGHHVPTLRELLAKIDALEDSEQD